MNFGEDNTISTVAKNIIRALSARYDYIVYLNTETNQYFKFQKNSKKIEHKSDYFLDIQNIIQDSVYKEDLKQALNFNSRQNLLKDLNIDESKSIQYRIKDNKFNNYRYFRETVSLNIIDNTRYLLLTWTNIDSQIKREKEIRDNQLKQRLSADILSALTSDYQMIYYIDLKDNSYVEYHSSSTKDEYLIKKQGRDFFKRAQEDVNSVVYHKDIERVSTALDKNALLSLMGDTPFLLTYRLLKDNQPVWHTMKCIYSDHKTHILIAVRNIDKQKRKESEYEDRLKHLSDIINRDELTDVRNKRAFFQEEIKWNQAINSEETTKFAIVICDINNLKETNDEKGHIIGDKLLIEAARTLEEHFPDSPIFRIGGDEFAIILSEDSYDYRNVLYEVLLNHMRFNNENNDVVIACGLAAYNKELDEEFIDVFNRADKNMYETKKKLKEEINNN